MVGSITHAPPALPAAVANLYAELLDLSEHDAALRDGAGSYNRKVISGTAHWYRQRSIGKRRVQTYIGPETPELLTEIARTRKDNALRRRELARRRAICRALRTALGAGMDLTTGRILRALAQAGAFAAGAVLIGSHAYATYGAMLGRKLADRNVQTTDVDIAAIDLGIASPLSFVDAIKSVDPEFFEVPPAPGSRLSTKLKLRGSEYRVDLLTPGPPRRDDRGATKPVPIPSLKFAATPLPYLDYLIARRIDAVAPVAEGVRVTVPEPARFALHKLIVAQERAMHAAVKRAKDLAQAQELIGVLAELAPEALAAAWDDLARRGPAYETRATRSLAALGLDATAIRPARARRQR